MKRHISCMLSLAIVACICSVSVQTAMAADADVAYTKEILQDPSCLVQISENNLETNYSLSTANFYRLSDALDKQKLSVSERNKEIYKALGFTDEEIETIGQEEIDRVIAETDNITVSESYVQVSPDGEQQKVSKEKCLNDLEISKQAKTETASAAGTESESSPKLNAATRAASNDSTEEEVVKDAMRIKTVSSYIRPGYTGTKGRYTISGTFTWLDAPGQRMTDAVSLYSPDLAFETGSDAVYSSMSCHYKYVEDSPVEFYRNEKDYELNKEMTEGRYVEWKLPKVSNAWDLCIYIRAKARVKHPTLETNFNLYSAYEHTYTRFIFDCSFKWSTSAPYFGVVANTTLITGHDHFSSMNFTEYKPDRNYK